MDSMSSLHRLVMNLLLFKLFNLCVIAAFIKWELQCSVGYSLHTYGSCYCCRLWESKMLHYKEALLRKSNLEACSVTS